jgi:transcriptional regulator with XRE-family HTH domain
VRNENDSLGHIIKSARMEKNLTQDQAAELLDVSPRHFQYIENDEKKPGYDLLCKIIHKLDISPDLLFYPQNEENNPELSVLFQKIRLCDKQQIAVIRATTEALLFMNHIPG